MVLTIINVSFFVMEMMIMQIVDVDNNMGELQKLIDRSVKDYKLQYATETYHSIMGDKITCIIPLIAVKRDIFDSLVDVDVNTCWQSINTAGGTHLFLTVRTMKHEWLFHFDTQNKDHRDWLTEFYNTPFCALVRLRSDQNNGNIGITGFKNSDPIIDLPPTETNTVVAEGIDGGWIF